MTEYFPVVVERESNGTFSAWVAGLQGVYAAADTAAAAKRAIRSALAAHLDALRKLGQSPKSKAEVMLLSYASKSDASRGEVRFKGIGALMGRVKSAAKAESSRRNGRKGGRPRKTAAKVAGGAR